MSKLLAMMMKPKEYMYATIKGSLTESPAGVFSGFSVSNFLLLQNNVNFSSIVEIKTYFTLNNSALGSQYDNYIYNSYLGRYLALSVDNTLHIVVRYGNGGNSWVSVITTDYLCSVDVKYYVKQLINGTSAKLYISTDNKTYTLIDTQTISQLTNSQLVYGSLNYNGTALNGIFNGSIDLNQSYIKINNTKYQLQAVVGYTEVGSPTITDGVVSGFSDSDYLAISKSSGDVNKIEVITKIDNIPETISDNNLIVGFNGNLSFHLFVNTSNKIQCNYKDTSNTTRNMTFANVTNAIFIKVIFNTSGVILYSSNDGINWYQEYNRTNIPILDNAFTNVRFGYMTSTYNVFNGDLYIKDTSIKINNKLWFNGQSAE